MNFCDQTWKNFDTTFKGMHTLPLRYEKTYVILNFKGSN